MELIVSTDGRQETVAVQEEGKGRFLVRLADRTFRVDSATSACGLRSLLVREDAGRETAAPDGIPQRHWEMSVHEESEGAYAVSAPGPRTATRIAVTDPLTHQAREALGEGGRAGPHRVAAYMPGRVIALLVEEGAQVAQGEGVLVLEAMKMENEIAAESSGTVRRLLVEAGQAVDSGDPLFEIE